MRVLCFGMDGADYDLVETLLAQGKLPTLTRLSREGGFGPLRSTIPPLSPVAWSTFLTGLNPGGHGIFGFSANPHRSVSRLESGANRAGIPLWRFLGAAGIRSAFITVPLTYPPEAATMALNPRPRKVEIAWMEQMCWASMPLESASLVDRFFALMTGTSIDPKRRADKSNNGKATLFRCRGPTNPMSSGRCWLRHDRAQSPEQRSSLRPGPTPAY
jgi:hypothetical protein